MPTLRRSDSSTLVRLLRGEVLLDLPTLRRLERLMNHKRKHRRWFSSCYLCKPWKSPGRRNGKRRLTHSMIKQLLKD